MPPIGHTAHGSPVRRAPADPQPTRRDGLRAFFRQPGVGKWLAIFGGAITLYLIVFQPNAAWFAVFLGIWIGAMIYSRLGDETRHRAIFWAGLVTPFIAIDYLIYQQLTLPDGRDLSVIPTMMIGLEYGLAVLVIVAIFLGIWGWRQRDGLSAAWLARRGFTRRRLAILFSGLLVAGFLAGIIANATRSGRQPDYSQVPVLKH